MHLIISKIDLTKPIDVEAVNNIVENSLVDGNISKETAKRINPNSIVSFFNSDLGQLARNAENITYREWPFTFATPATDSRDTIVVQGIIDMLIKTPEGLVVVDFKTDRISKQQITERAELYRDQIDLYSRAAEAILKTKVLSKWLYFISAGEPVKV